MVKKHSLQFPKEITKILTKRVKQQPEPSYIDPFSINAYENLTLAEFEYFMEKFKDQLNWMEFVNRYRWYN